MKAVDQTDKPEESQESKLGSTAEVVEPEVSEQDTEQPVGEKQVLPDQPEPIDKDSDIPPASEDQLS